MHVQGHGSNGTHAHSCTAAQTKQAMVGSGNGLPALVSHSMSLYPSAYIKDCKRDHKPSTLSLNQTLYWTDHYKLLEILKWIWNLFSVALVLLISGLKKSANLKANCPVEISFVQFDHKKKILKTLKTLEPNSLAHISNHRIIQFHVPHTQIWENTEKCIKVGLRTAFLKDAPSFLWTPPPPIYTVLLKMSEFITIFGIYLRNIAKQWSAGHSDKI